MASELAKKKCEPCSGNTPALRGKELENLHSRVSDRWQIINDHHIEAEFAFDDFRQALDFTNQIGEIAEEEGHHPDIYLSWGKVEVKLWTHAIDGLSESDFIMAAKIDDLADE